MNKYTIEQSGRSMIEMLGVLAIVGVLSVAGIAGYSKAMAKYKVNKVVDQITMTSANIKTTFAGQGDYAGLNTGVAHDLGVFPEEMDKTVTGSGSGLTGVKNALGGDVKVKVAGDSDLKFSFDIQFDGLSKDACSTLATADWGSASGFSGFVGGVGGTAISLKDSNDKDMGIVAGIAQLCKCTTENTCSLTWRFR